MAPDRHRGKYEANRKEDGAKRGSSHGVHAPERTADPGPGEEKRKDNAEGHNLIEMKIERKEGRRPRSRDVDEPPGRFSRLAMSTRKLGHREEAEEGERGYQ